ncbi:RAB2A [Bugula neritina]|uniref:RAB2A n=1 Tax=Bugula neritina TaxID=10212 RepID=A0A7J7IVH0_BUGNE|nr:RAB2A [Bugula neritina]
MNRSQSTRKTLVGFDYGIKCIALGDSGVGKTSLLQKMGNAKHAMKTTPTVEGIFHSKVLTTSGRKIQLSIWDTAGQETFRSVTRIYYRGASCALLVYDVTRRSSFNSISVWLGDLRDNSSNTKPVLILVANKCDLSKDREVSSTEGNLFAKQHNMSYIETSAEKALNIERVFETLAKDVYHNIKIGNIVPNSEVNGIKVGRMPSSSSEDDIKKKRTSCTC